MANEWPQTVLNPDVIDIAEVVNKLAHEMAESQQSQAPMQLHPSELDRWEKAYDAADTVIKGIVSREQPWDVPAVTPQVQGSIPQAQLAKHTPNPFLNRHIRLLNQLIEAAYRSQSAVQGRDLHPSDVNRFREGYLREGYRLIAEQRGFIDGGALDFPETAPYSARFNLPSDVTGQPVGGGTNPALPDIKNGGSN